MTRMKKIVAGAVVIAGLAAALRLPEDRTLCRDATSHSPRNHLYPAGRHRPRGAGRAAGTPEHHSHNGRWFQWLLKLEPELAEFKAGTYRFTPGMTVRQMLQLLASGKEAQFPLRFVEGSRLKEWLAELRKAPNT